MNIFIFIILVSLTIGQTSSDCCCLSREEKQQLDTARRTIQRIFKDNVRLNNEARDFALSSHRAITEAEKIKARHPELVGMKIWFGRLLDGVKKVQGISGKIDMEVQKMALVRNEMEKCLDRKDLPMCKELADEAKQSSETVKKYREDIGQAYRNAYTQSDLGIGELSEKVKETLSEYLSRSEIRPRFQTREKTFKDGFME